MNGALLAMIVMLSFLVETAAGFGSTVIALAVGALLFPLPWLMAVVVPVNMVVSSVVAGRDWRAIDGRFLLRRVLPAMVLGLALGVGLFGAAQGRGLKLAYAVFVIGLAARELLVRRGAAGSAGPLSTPATLGWLFAGGLAHGVFAASGPLVVFVVSRSLPEKRVFRATLAALWLVLNGALLVSYALRGALTPETGAMALWMLPPMVLGILAGDAVHRRLDPARFRSAVYGLMLASGLTLLVAAW